MTTTFETRGAVTVTIPADTFLDEATEHAATATKWATDAELTSARAHAAAAGLPSEFRTHHGLTAAEVLAMIDTDTEAAQASGRRARRYAADADAATTARAAALAAEDARACAASGRYHADAVARLAAYVTA